MEGVLNTPFFIQLICTPNGTYSSHRRPHCVRIAVHIAVNIVPLSVQ